MRKPALDLEAEMKSREKTQTEGNLEMKKLGTQTGTDKARLTNKIEEMEERITGIEDSIKEMNITVKENMKSKNISCTNIREIWVIKKRPNL